MNINFSTIEELQKISLENIYLLIPWNLYLISMAFWAERKFVLSDSCLVLDFLGRTNFNRYFNLCNI